MFWLVFILTSLFRSFSITRKYGIERIVNFAPFYTALSVLPIMLLHIPAITFIRADNTKHSSNRMRNCFFLFVDWIGIILSNRVVFVSETLRDIYIKRYRLSQHKCVIIPNDIETLYSINPEVRLTVRQSLGINPDDFLIATSGVFNADKNFSFLIEALCGLTQSSVKLLIIGDETAPTGERQRLEHLVTDFGLNSYVIFAGWQVDPRPFIGSADLFIFPSKHEGSPNALLEALGCRIPCLGSNIPEIKEILLDEELLFPLDDTQILINKIVALCTCQNVYTRARHLSQRRCEDLHFHWGQRIFDVIHMVR